MPGPKVKQFQSGTLAKTIDVHQPDFQEDIQYDGTTVNVTSGLQEGIGPRYGFAPIPGQMDAEAVASGNFAGILKAETSWFTGITRQNIYAIIPLVLGGCDSASAIAKKQIYYAVVLGYLDTNYSGQLILDVVFLATSVTATNVIMQQSNEIYAGLGYTGTADYASIAIFAEMLQSSLATDPSYYNAISTLGTVASSTNYVSATAFTVTNGETAYNWIAGVTSFGTLNSSTIAPSIESLTPYTFVRASGGTTRRATAFFGVTSDCILGTFATGGRTANIYSITSTGQQNLDWTASFTASNSIFQPNFNFEQINNPEINLSSVAAAQNDSGTTYSSTVVALYNDTQMTTNSSYKGVLVAAGKAFCVLTQDWLRSYGGRLQQYVDLTNISYNPQPLQTNYTENGAPVSSPFLYWPEFTSGNGLGAMLTVSLNGANTGILRANTLYQFSYSIYNKRLNFETNVASPVQFLVGTNDFVSIQLYDNTVAGASTQLDYLLRLNHALLPWPGNYSVNGVSNGGTNNFSINDLEYRFYYRQTGLAEWLPALFIDAAQWWFYPYFTNLSACTGGIGGLPGGRPGGYSDYSQLPADKYDCVVMFKNRAFWASPSNLVFSRQNNIFAYPTGNSASCPAGSYKGMIVATYYGQAQQQARLVVFTTEGTYIGIFTGNPVDIPVQVSASSIGSFPLDGSDFTLNAWTSITAFSYRAAANCEGILYFWGPQGIFQDDGVNPITRISPPLEPDLFEYYNPSETDQINAVYNNNTKEITWFYPPKVADSNYPTYALIFNRQRQTWLFAKYPGQVDAAQQLNVRTAVPTGGSRTVVFSRQTPSSAIQRAYFYDERNLAGDIFPSKELMVKAVSTPSTGSRRLTLAAGYTTAVFDTINVGDVLCLQQVAQYATSMTTPSDMIAEVSAINTGAGTVDIILPSGATLDSSWTAGNNSVFFPIYHAAAAYSTAENATLLTGPGINGFNYQISTKYWIPAGITYWGWWLWYHLLFKLRLFLPSSAPLITQFAHRTPISDVGYVTKTLTITNNSDSNFQAFVQLILGNQNLEGQGVRIQLSGVQIGGAWVLQSINGQSAMIDGDQLKIFEE